MCRAMRTDRATEDSYDGCGRSERLLYRHQTPAMDHPKVQVRMTQDRIHAFRRIPLRDTSRPKRYRVRRKPEQKKGLVSLRLERRSSRKLFRADGCALEAGARRRGVATRAGVTESGYATTAPRNRIENDDCTALYQHKRLSVYRNKEQKNNWPHCDSNAGHPVTVSSDTTGVSPPSGS